MLDVGVALLDIGLVLLDVGRAVSEVEKELVELDVLVLLLPGLPESTFSSLLTQENVPWTSPPPPWETGARRCKASQEEVML